MNGQTGANQFVDVARVEVYRGPQSAAFGRATFAGAINYVSRNPGEEFEGYVEANVSDLDRQQISTAISGPLGDKFGFTLDINSEEVRDSDQWVSTDGYGLGSTQTDYISAKLTFAPTGRIDGQIKIIHLETDDAPS